MRNCLVGLCLALAACSAVAQRISLVDRIVAVVNSEVVTMTELTERVEFAMRQLQRQGTPAPDRAVLQSQALERLILDKAQFQFARESGIRVDEVQLDRAIERIAENNNLALPAFRRMLEKDGVQFERFREEIREQIVLSRLREREVDDKIQVSESEIDLFLEQAKTQDVAADSAYNISHILVRIPEQASPERVDQARQRAEKARGEAASGDFARVAASYSDAPDALRGGEMGWRAADRLPEIFPEALKRMRAGEVSPVLRSPAGFHVVKLIDRRGGSALPSGAPVVQTRARHILVRTNELVSEADAQRRLTGLRERLTVGKADFAELARLHSEDGTAARGGDLEWVYPGDTVPEFERAMNGLKPGDVSQPVKTPFGWHLIQVMERRTGSLSTDRVRMQARVALKERKADEAFQEWLRQLRDRTYVELRLEDK
ncbi:MAG: molecular chaperone SurA [Betaproteobacteria bacterium]|nr:molecular chaperone SurA [Betaproteobacteria bacterium]